MCISLGISSVSVMTSKACIYPSLFYHGLWEVGVVSTKCQSQGKMCFTAIDTT